MAVSFQGRILRGIKGVLFGALMVVGGLEQAFALIGGRSDHPERFPATVRFEGVEICTATIVGAKAVLTAGHCVGDKSPPDFAPGNVEFGGKKLLVLCTRHPEAKLAGKDVPWNDVALCRLAETSQSFAGVKFEVVQTDATKIREDTSVVLLGYGCEDPKKEVPSKGLRWGAAGLGIGGKSKDPASPTLPRVDDALMKVDGGAILCKGDSGSGALDSDDLAKRSVIGVGIYGDSQNNDPKLNKISRLVQTTDGRIKNWLKAWGDKWAAPICGVHASATGCR